MRPRMASSSKKGEKCYVQLEIVDLTGDAWATGREQTVGCRQMSAWKTRASLEKSK